MKPVKSGSKNIARKVGIANRSP